MFSYQECIGIYNALTLTESWLKKQKATQNLGTIEKFSMWKDIRYFAMIVNFSWM